MRLPFSSLFVLVPHRQWIYMDLFLRKGKFVNILMIISLSILLISIIPIIVVSFYSHPLADDFNFSANNEFLISL